MPYAVTLRFKTVLFVSEITRTVQSLNDVHLLEGFADANDYEVASYRKLDDVVDAHRVIRDIEEERFAHKNVATGGK